MGTAQDEAERLIAEAPDLDWLRTLADELDRAVRQAPLERLIRLCGALECGGGASVRCSRQAFSKWLKTGVPADRMSAVADLAAATDLLDRRIKRERIAAVVRRPSDLLGGRSLYDPGDGRRARRSPVGRGLDLRPAPRPAVTGERLVPYRMAASSSALRSRSGPILWIRDTRLRPVVAGIRRRILSDAVSERRRRDGPHAIAAAGRGGAVHHGRSGRQRPRPRRRDPAPGADRVGGGAAARSLSRSRERRRACGSAADAFRGGERLLFACSFGS